LIGQEIRNELSGIGKLRYLGVPSINVRDEKYASVVGILETRPAAYALFVDEIEGETRLLHLLTKLDIPFRDLVMGTLHTAANNAKFTMKLLLMLVVKSVEGWELVEDRKVMVERLRAIAHVSIEKELSCPTPDYERKKRMDYRKSRRRCWMKM